MSTLQTTLGALMAKMDVLIVRREEWGAELSIVSVEAEKGGRKMVVSGVPFDFAIDVLEEFAREVSNGTDQ